MGQYCNRMKVAVLVCVCCVYKCDHLLVVEGPSSEPPTLHRCVSMLMAGAALDRAAPFPSPVRSPWLQVRSLPRTGEWTLALSCAALWSSPPPVARQSSAARTDAAAAAGELTVLRSTTFPAAACSANGQSLSGEFTALAWVTSGPQCRRMRRSGARTGSPYAPALVTRRQASAWHGHRRSGDIVRTMFSRKRAGLSADGRGHGTRSHAVPQQQHFSLRDSAFALHSPSFSSGLPRLFPLPLQSQAPPLQGAVGVS